MVLSYRPPTTAVATVLLRVTVAVQDAVCDSSMLGAPIHLLSRRDGEGKPILRRCQWARRIRGEGARRIGRPVEIQEHPSVARNIGGEEPRAAVRLTAR